MSKIKNSGLDQYGAEPFEQEQFGTAGVEGVKTSPFTSIQLLCLTYTHRPFKFSLDCFSIPLCTYLSSSILLFVSYSVVFI